MRFAYLIEPPFNYRASDGKLVGCDVDVARHVFRELGEPFEPVETEFAGLLPGLSDGRWNMTTGLFATEERQRNALFSRPIWALPDGLLVARGNPLALSGYRSVAENGEAALAVIRGQFQHLSALEFGVPHQRLRIFETYTEAASAVRDGLADAYASVGRAHMGFIEQNADWEIESVEVPHSEKPPAFGSFAFARSDAKLKDQVDEVLTAFLGTEAHRHIVGRYGFADSEVDLVVPS